MGNLLRIITCVAIALGLLAVATSVQATMTFLHSVAIAFLAGAAGLLALDTLVSLGVVVLHRHATLQQVNASLAQISSQLRQLHAGTQRD